MRETNCFKFKKKKHNININLFYLISINIDPSIQVINSQTLL
jgi:hypothetical protein